MAELFQKWEIGVGEMTQLIPHKHEGPEFDCKTHIYKMKTLISWARWHRLLISALKNQRQADHHEATY